HALHVRLNDLLTDTLRSEDNAAAHPLKALPEPPRESRRHPTGLGIAQGSQRSPRSQRIKEYKEQTRTVFPLCDLCDLCGLCAKSKDHSPARPRSGHLPRALFPQRRRPADAVLAIQL